MSDDRVSGKRDERGDQGSSLESISHAAVRRQVLSEALQHPATLLAFAVAFLAFVFAIVFDLGALWAVAAVGLLLSIGSFSWRYIIRYNQEYSRKLQEATELYQRRTQESEEAGLEQQRRTLEQGFTETGSQDGLRALGELVQEYHELQQTLQRREGTSSLGSMSHVPGMADQVYREGLNILSDALELIRSTRSSSKKQLETEIASLEKEVQALRGDESQAERLRIRQATLDSYRERLELLEGQQLRVDQLLHQADQCEGSLYRAKIELAALKAENSQASVGSVTESLQGTIDQAKALQEEFRKMGL